MSYSERGGCVRMCGLPKKLRVEGIISSRWMACLLGLIGVYLFVCFIGVVQRCRSRKKKFPFNLSTGVGAAEATSRVFF